MSLLAAAVGGAGARVHNDAEKGPIFKRKSPLTIRPRVPAGTMPVSLPADAKKLLMTRKVPLPAGEPCDPTMDTQAAAAL